MKKILLLLLLVTGFQTKCYCQSSNWVHYGAENTIHDFEFNGSTVWMATGAGLVKFDTITKQTAIFNQANSGLPTDELMDLTIDTNGVVWIVTNFFGLVRFDGINWTIYTTSNSGIPSNQNQCIAIDSLNRVWIAQNYVCVFDGINWTTLYSLGGNFAKQISFHDSTVWVVTGNGITKFDGTNWFPYTAFNSTLSNSIKKIAIGSSGDIWLITDNFNYPLSYFDGSNLITFPSYYPTSCNASWVDYNSNMPIAADSLGNGLFFGTINGSQETVLFKNDGSSCSSYDSIPFGDLGYVGGGQGTGFMKYIDGNLWFGSDLLYKFDGNNWTAYNYRTNPLNGITYSMAIDNNYLYWFGGRKSIISFDGTTWSSYKFADSLPALATATTALAIDSSGIKWIGTMNGLIKYDGNSFTYFMPGPSVMDIKLDSLQHPWIATYDSGVFYYNGLNFINYNSLNSGLPGNEVHCVEIDNYGTIWFGTEGFGLSSFDGSTWTNYTTSNSGLSEDNIHALKCDSNGTMWIGAGYFSGIDKKTGNNWINYNSSNSPLLSDEIKVLQIDKNNNLYISSGFSKERIQIFDGVNWIFVADSNLGINPVQSLKIMFDKLGNTIYAGVGGVDFYNNGDLTFEHYPSIIGKVYYDANSNGIEDSLDKGMFNQKVTSYPDSITAFTNSNGNYWYGKTQGNYIVSFNPQPGWLLTSDSASYNINLGPNDQTGFDFGTYGINPVDSVSVSITSGIIRCNQTIPFWLNYTNSGTTLLNGTIKLKIDTSMIYSYSNPTPDNISADTLIWNFNNLYPGEQRIICAYLDAPSVNSVGQQISFTGIAETQNGGILNTANYQSIVFCSFDPNDKLAEPVGYGPNHFTHFNDSIEYTVRFQNCGNDTAFRIKIVDTLDASFDINSFRVLAGSHPVYTSITSQGVITFRFDSIMLPCKSANEPMSQGFVKYSVLHKQGLADPTIVKNYASIYFDANPPIRTNETFNTLSDIFAGINSAQNKNDKLVSVYPNPANQLVTILPGKTISYSLAIFDALGNIQFVKQNLNGKQQLDLSQLKQGVYFYKVIYKNEEGCNGKLVLIH